MDGVCHAVGGEHQDHPLDLPPLAEAREVADIAAMFRPRCRLEPGLVAIGANQILGKIDGGAISDVKRGGNLTFSCCAGSVQVPCQAAATAPRDGRQRDTMFNGTFTKCRGGTHVPF